MPSRLLSVFPLPCSILLLAFVAGPLCAQGVQQPAQLPAQLLATTYKPITGAERFRWAVRSTVGPRSLTMGIVSAGWGTMLNNPEEYGPQWEGFGKRYGMRLTGVSTGNAMEAGVGAIFGEDPRYFRSGGSFEDRWTQIVKMTVLAHRRDGSLAPAYARMGATLGNNFLSSTWRVESEKGAGQALIRSGLGVLGRMAGNAVTEYWPDLCRLFLGRRNP